MFYKSLQKEKKKKKKGTNRQRPHLKLSPKVSYNVEPPPTYMCARMWCNIRYHQYCMRMIIGHQLDT